MKPQHMKLVPEVNLTAGRPYKSSDTTDIRERFRSVNVDWNKRPAYLEPRSVVRNRINGWS